MYQKFWKQFLTEQDAEATYEFVPDSRELARDVPSTVQRCQPCHKMSQ